MSLATPLTQELADSIVAQIEIQIEQDIPILPKAFTRVLAKVLAAVHVILYKYAGWIALQQFVASASMEETVINGRRLRPLVEWGRQIGLGDPGGAETAQLTLQVTVTNQTGTLDSGKQLLFASTGVVYTTAGSVALNASTVQVTVLAAQEGAIGNLAPGDTLSFVNPLANVASNATVVSADVLGADAEDPEAYRTRVIERFQRKPQGGAYADYDTWARTVSGIINVYPYRGVLPGEVDVYCEASQTSSGSADGIPTAGQLSEVAQSIEFDVDGVASNRPVSAAVNVRAITRTPFDVNVVGLTAPDLAEAQTTIAQAVDEFLRTCEPFIVGLTSFPRRDRITLSAVSGVVSEAVSSLGGSVTSVSLSRLGAPVTAYQLVDGEKAKLGTASF